jgi:hypothetical protein
MEQKIEEELKNYEDEVEKFEKYLDWLDEFLELVNPNKEQPHEFGNGDHIF